MFYIRLKEDDANKLVYYCRNCGNEEENFSEETIILSTSKFEKQEKQFNYVINKYTKLDPTLPRVKNIECPNIDCKTSNDSDVEKEILFIRFNEKDMKYVYLCSSCDNVWQIKKDY
jgi:DNA-directed RNA polymerase subunit M/transcription elongation factor TFIIS